MLIAIAYSVTVCRVALCRVTLCHGRQQNACQRKPEWLGKVRQCYGKAAADRLAIVVSSLHVTMRHMWGAHHNPARCSDTHHGIIAGLSGIRGAPCPSFAGSYIGMSSDRAVGQYRPCLQHVVLANPAGVCMGWVGYLYDRHRAWMAWIWGALAREGAMGSYFQPKIKQVQKRGCFAGRWPVGQAERGQAGPHISS